MATPPILSNDAAGIRRSRRLKVDFPIKVFLVQDRRRSVLQGRSHDLSQEGMAIYIPAELQIGQIVQIEFCVPFSQQRLESHAWSEILKDSGVGSNFETSLRRNKTNSPVAAKDCGNRFSPVQRLAVTISHTPWLRFFNSTTSASITGHPSREDNVGHCAISA